MVEPGQLQILVVDLRFRAEFEISSMGDLILSVGPGSHKQVLGGFLHPAQGHITFTGVAGIGVIPTAQVKGGNIRMFLIVLGDGIAALFLPVAVIVAVGEDIQRPPLVRWQPS